MHSDQISLAIADNHIMVREGICSLLTKFTNFCLDIEADDGVDLIEKLVIARKLPDICIVDIHMPRKNGWETLQEIKKRWPGIKVIILAMLHDKDIMNVIVKSGADGYLPKNASACALQQSLLELQETGQSFPKSMLKQVYSIMKEDKNYLNKKELEFLSHCCDDNNYKEIAQKMCVSPRTVEGYRDSLFIKLNINTRMGLAIYALKNGIVSLFDK